MRELLKTEHLSVSFFTKAGEVEAVRDVSLTVEEGEVLAIVGESGCGKSALCKSIMKLLPKTAKIKSGKILADGIDITDYTQRNMSRLRGALFSMIFQDPMTSLNPHEFSGGMRQRAVMAIALAGNPKILFADEPTTALDVTIQAQILDVFRRIQKKLGMATVFISHDLGVVAGVADRVAVMYAGKIVEIGTAEEIFYDPRHPYTWGLLQSLPILSRGKEWLPTLPGMPPTLIHPPKGDAFAERNAYAMRIDYEKEPPMFQVTDTHYAATWLLDERAPEVKAPIGERRYGK